MSSPIVDTHAHVFTRDLPMAAGRRYTPAYDAPLQAYLDRLSRHGVAHGVLVQPSFLGTDNRYLIDCLLAAPETLRGIAVVDPSISDASLDRMDRAGIVGIRFNLIGESPDMIAAPDYRALVARVSARGWQIEVQAEGPDLPAILDELAPIETPIVIDHFGKPDPKQGIACQGFRRLLSCGPTGNVFVKLSAPYRIGGAEPEPYATWLFRFLGAGRLVWGSDWPWTQNEGGRDYGAERDRIRALVPGEAEWQKMHATARALFRFGPPVLL